MVLLNFKMVGEDKRRKIITKPPNKTNTKSNATIERVGKDIINTRQRKSSNILLTVEKTAADGRLAQVTNTLKTRQAAGSNAKKIIAKVEKNGCSICFKN